MATSNLNIKLEPLTVSDLEHVVQLQPEGWGDILSSIRFYCETEFCHPLKATSSGNLVGIGTAIIHGATAWLAHIIVHKNHRSMGVGTIITKSLIDLVRETSCDTILLIATALGEPVYKRLGFTVHAEYMFFDDGKLPAAADAMGIVPFDPQYHDALLRLDRRASGEDRKRLLQPHLPNTKLALDGNEVKAFLIPTLGEGLIVSVDPSAGTELMKHKSAINSMFCIPLENVHGVNFLKEHGFKEVRKASRMILGKKIRWDGSTIFSRIGGNLG